MLNLCGRLGMAILEGAWRYLGISSSAYHCLVVAAATLSYLTLIPRLPSVV